MKDMSLLPHVEELAFMVNDAIRFVSVETSEKKNLILMLVLLSMVGLTLSILPNWYSLVS